MDHRVLAHYDGDITRVNIHPRMRDKVLARVRSRRRERLPLPGCDYIYDEAKGAPREGFPAGTPLGRDSRRLVLPDCAVREKVDFEADGE